MAVKFMGKNPHKKYVRPIPNGRLRKAEPVMEQPVVKENKSKNEDEKMADERLEKIEKIMNTKAPKRKVKVEKKEKGLIERTESSTILITEDNKMMLND
jgi:hypothetical protein